MNREEGNLHKADMVQIPSHVSHGKKKSTAEAIFNEKEHHSVYKMAQNFAAHHL